MRQDTNTTTTSTSTQESPDVADSGSVGRHPRSTSPTSGTATRVVDRSWVVVGAVVVTIAIVAGVWIALASDTSSTTSDGADRAEAANQLRRAEVDTIAGNAVDISTVAERANQRRQIEAGVPLEASDPSGGAVAADKANSLQRADARATRSGADLAAANGVREADTQTDTVTPPRDGAALAAAANGVREADASTSTTTHDGAALADAANGIREADATTSTSTTTRDGAALAEAANGIREGDASTSTTTHDGAALAEAANGIREADATTSTSTTTHDGAALADAANGVREADASTPTTTHDGAALADAANGVRQDDTASVTGDAVAAEKANRLRQAG